MIDDIEFNPYFGKYIQLSVDKPAGEALSEGLQETERFFSTIPKEKQEYCYAKGKWTPKEVLLHLIDTERVFMYRALQISRADHVDLQGFDQDEFASNSEANTRSMDNLLNEYRAVRQASVQFISSCSENTLKRMGKASNSPLSVRAAAYIVSGHEKHHCQFIKENYL